MNDLDRQLLPKMVTRKIVKEKTYDVFSLENGELIKKGTKTTKGRISERELEKELGIEKVIVKETKAVYATYGMPVDDFMKHAIEIKTEIK